MAEDLEWQFDVLRATVKGRPWSSALPSEARAQQEGRAASAAAAHAAAVLAGLAGAHEDGAHEDGAHDGDDDDDDDDDEQGASEPLQLQNTWEDERGLGEVPDDKRMGNIVPPCVVARNDGPNKFRCHCCGESGGYDVQLPLHVFMTAYRHPGGGGKLAVHCLREMAQHLVRGEFEKVFERATCCKKLGCLIGQGLLSADDYCRWVKVVKRVQLQRGTDRKDQSRLFCENVCLLRMLALENPAPLSVRELRALFEFLVLNSQFVQEREKRFIATAMAAVGSPQHFRFKFADPNSIVKRMAQIPRNYASKLIFPHIIDPSLSPKKWVSKGNRLLETAFPKASDALFTILCLENAHANENEEENGRMVHRVPEGAPYASLFTPDGFHDALWWACGGEKPRKYTLHFASSERDLRQTATSTDTRAQRQMQRMLATLSATQRKATTTGKGAAAAFTCGSQQANSGVHPKERYWGVLKALGYTDAEAAKRVALFLDEWPTNNPHGFEKLKKGSELSKACETVRPVQVVKPKVHSTFNPTRAARSAGWDARHASAGKRPRMLGR